VSYFNLRLFLLLSLVAYPILMVAFLIIATIAISMCLWQRSEAKTTTQTYLHMVDGLPDTAGTGHQDNTIVVVSEPEPEAQSCHPDSAVRQSDFRKAKNAVPTFLGEDYAPPILARSSLTPCSQNLYACWVYFCCCVPSLMVFGSPLLMILLSYPHPQEVNGILGLITAGIVFTNSNHMVVYAWSSLRMVQKQMEQYVTCDANVLQKQLQVDPPVKHWVILPQYEETVEVLSMTLRSISCSSLAASSISLVLAMEERELESVEKADILKRTFEADFAEILVTYHPSDLPDDPPGKASNLKWAYGKLLSHLTVTHG
jgi:hypothetical protein